MKRAGMLLFIFLLLSFLAGFITPASAQETYKRMLDDPSQFHGPVGQSLDPSTLDYIKIGLFAPDDPADESAKAVYRGVQLALEEANARGGYMGVKFKFLRRWAKDPWAAGSKEMIKLVYTDGVWAVISYRDGASHIAQQIAAKAFVPVVSPVSTAVSLTRARVPWMFRLPPDDKKQARKVVEQAFQAKGLRKIGVISATDHDSRASATEFMEELKKLHLPPLFHFQLAPGTRDFRDIVSRIKMFRPDGLVSILPVQGMVYLLNVMQREGLDCTVALPWRPGLVSVRERTGYKGPLYLLDPLSLSQNKNRARQAFHRNYRARFNESPPHCAIYSYDAARIIIIAIRSAGLNRPAIRKAIAGLTGFQGASGVINWDNSGNNRL